MSVVIELFCTTAEQLAACCDHLESVRQIGFDTEFVGEDRFRPDLCLIQLATIDHLYVIDPYTVGSLERFWRILIDPARQLIVHAGREEIRMCQFNSGEKPSNLFDVQIAAGLLGLGYPLGYSALIQKILRKKLNKGETLTDWRRRPLSDQQLQYAFDDVRYLLPLCKRITNRLQRRKRLDWAKEEFGKFLQRAMQENPEQEKWRKLRGLGNLDRRRLAVVREVFRWRDEKAEQINRPAKQLLRDDLIVEIARRNPNKEADFSTLRGLQKGDANGILEAAERARKLPLNQCPQPAEREDDPPQVAMITSLLTAVLNDLCTKKQLTTSLVATTAHIKQLIRSEMKRKPIPASCELSQGWRKEHILPELLAILRGEQSVRIGNLSTKSPFEYVPVLDLSKLKQMEDSSRSVEETTDG